MIFKFIIWVITKIYKSRIKRAIGLDNLIALKNLCNSYIRNENNKSIKRSIFISEFLKLGIQKDEFQFRIKKCWKSLSSHIDITNDFYLFMIFIRRFNDIDLRKPKNKEALDEMISNVDYLLNNL